MESFSKKKKKTINALVKRVSYFNLREQKQKQKKKEKERDSI